MFLSKLLHVFVKLLHVFLSLCQTKLKFGQDYEACVEGVAIYKWFKHSFFFKDIGEIVCETEV